MNCDIIRDLLPLYADDVCSQASRQMVESHLDTCESCRAELSVMRCGEPAVIAEEVEAAQAAGKAWKKRKLRSVLLGILAAAALFGTIYGLTVPNILPVDEGYLRVDDVIYNPAVGYIQVKLTVMDGMKHNFIRYRQVGDAFYITPMRPIITTREDDDWVERKNTHTHNIGEAAAGKALYVGWGDDAVLVWDESWKDRANSAVYDRLEEQIREDRIPEE